MRIFLLSDIHSNLEALEACLAAAPEHDLVVNLGDTVGYGGNPNEVIARVKPLASVFVRGNHDKAVSGLINLEEFNPVAGLATLWTRDQLTKGNIEWLRGFDGFPWLAQSHLYPALIPIYLWMACGFNLILYLAAMEGIDPQLYEAAEIDGAPWWMQFLTITLPLIREVLAISAVFLVIGGLNAFEMVWLLTSQDPSAAVSTLGTLLVTTMFKDFDMGGAAALAVILCALVLSGSAAVLRGLRSEPVES